MSKPYKYTVRQNSSFIFCRCLRFSFDRTNYKQSPESVTSFAWHLSGFGLGMCRFDPSEGNKTRRCKRNWPTTARGGDSWIQLTFFAPKLTSLNFDLVEVVFFHPGFRQPVPGRKKRYDRLLLQVKLYILALRLRMRWSHHLQTISPKINRFIIVWSTFHRWCSVGLLFE